MYQLMCLIKGILIKDIFHFISFLTCAHVSLKFASKHTAFSYCVWQWQILCMIQVCSWLVVVGGV